MKIKVLTLNVWHGGRLWDNLVDFLKAEDADVLLLQEFHAEKEVNQIPRLRTLEEFRTLFQYTADDFAPALEWSQAGFRVTQGNAVFSKFPIAERYEPIFFNEPFSDHYVDIPANVPTCPRNLQHVTLDVQGTPLDVFNFQGVWDLNGTNDSPQRLRMSQVITDSIAGRHHVVLGGDTNAQRDCQTIRNIEAHLHNVFGDELPTSFNVRHKDLDKYPGYATTTVDMLFTSPSLKVTEHYCPDVNVSDHLTLIALIEVPEA